VTPEPDRFSVEIDEHRVAWVTLRTVGGTVSHADLRALEDAVRLLERAAGDRRARSAILLSGSAETFLGEIDLRELEEARAVPDGAGTAEWVRTGTRVLRRLDLLPIPTVAAVEGDCSGPGAAVALACTYRVAVGSPVFRIGFRERDTGFLPFWGAASRLPRLVGLRPASEMVRSGRWIDAEEARELGLLDALLEDHEAAGAFAAEKGRRPPGRATGGGRLVRRLLTTVGGGRRRPASDARFNPTAAGAAPDAIAQLAALPLEEALEREAALVVQRLGSADLEPFLHLARMERRARDPAVSGTLDRLQEAGVLGSDDAAVALTALLSTHGLRVRLKARRRDAALRAVLAARAALSRPGGVDDADERVGSGVGFGGFGALDLVLAPEGPTAAADLLAAEDHVRDDCVLVIIDPPEPLDALQQRLRHPERLSGLRFPRPRLAAAGLVEILRGTRTAPAAVERLRNLVVRLRGVPVVTTDAPGGLVDRCVLGLILEALWLRQEGVDPAVIEQGARLRGIDPPPLARAETLGAHWLLERSRLLAAAGYERFLAPPLLERLVDGGGEPAVAGGDFRSSGLADGGSSDVAAVGERLALRVLVESLHAVDEGIVLQPGAVDLAVVLAGLAPRSRGGPLFDLRRTGVISALHALERLSAEQGARFAPPAFLRSFAEGTPSPPSGPGSPDTGHEGPLVIS
jgi:enoyl-CoA hydratase/carnithine racemase